MPSITVWNRIEPRARANDLTPGLEARVHDPLWLLARQWQIGEFEGRDTGSPVSAAVQYSVAALDRFSIAGQPAEIYDRSQPIETLIERERARPDNSSGDLQQAAEAGLYFSRLLAAAKLPSSINALYVKQYALAPAASSDSDTVAMAGIVTGRVIDGIRLHADLVAAGANLPALPAIPSAQHDAVLQVTRDWLGWYGSLFDESTQDGWSPDRMEYSFAMSAAGVAGSYIAQEYDGSSVEWYTFDRSAAALPGAPAAPALSTVNRQVLATPVTFRGMPARRFWELEDAATNIGLLSAAAEDLGRLLLREFALIYGNDWFQFPLSLQTGSRSVISSLFVSDTFGITTAIPHYSAADGAAGKWRVFDVDPSIPELLLTPGAVSPLESSAIEDVLLLRDELADLVWAIERTVAGSSGEPLDRTVAWRGSLSAPAPPSDDPTPHYRLGSTVPDYWLPFLPVAANPGDPLKLRRGRLPTAANGPLGRLLGYPAMAIFLEEVPREGVHLERRYRSARGPGGSTHLWIGRRRSVGRGEGRSGLQFDFLEFPQ